VNPLVGTWQLVISEWRAEDGQVITAMGREAPAVGCIIYTEDGHMAFQSMAANRPNFAAGDIGGGTPEEKIAAFGTFAAYCGTYDLQDDTVVHHVKASLFPNWVGADQVRTFTLSGDELELSTPPVLFEGKMRTAHVVFRHARPRSTV
jgi:lipocalin-like protein